MTATVIRLPNASIDLDGMIALNHRVAELKASGMTCEDIGNVLDISRNEVEKVCKSDRLPIIDVPKPSRRLDAKELAALVRKALKQSFPGVKFSVRTDRYSMGSSVNVSWTDGPTSNQVDEILDIYRDVDGTRNDDTEIMRCNALDGEPVRFGSYVFGHRQHSDTFIASVKKSVAALSDVERAKFMAALTDHQQDYPYTVVSLCQRQDSPELSRVTRLDYLPR
jgi:DNA-binding CsgD family transcriptional regulator